MHKTDFGPQAPPRGVLARAPRQGAPRTRNHLQPAQPSLRLRRRPNRLNIQVSALARYPLFAVLKGNHKENRRFGSSKGKPKGEPAILGGLLRKDTPRLSPELPGTGCAHRHETRLQSQSPT